MALTATIYRVSVELGHLDRGVYETLDLRLARHPSETLDYMATRLLAYCLEYTEGIAFTDGVSSTSDEPAILVRDLTGRITARNEIRAAGSRRGSRSACRPGSGCTAATSSPAAPPSTPIEASRRCWAS